MISSRSVISPSAASPRSAVDVRRPRPEIRATADHERSYSSPFSFPYFVVFGRKGFLANYSTTLDNRPGMSTTEFGRRADESKIVWRVDDAPEIDAQRAHGSQVHEQGDAM